MKRKKFLTEFLGALGAVNIVWDRVEDGFISGRIEYECDVDSEWYDPDDEFQNFCWHATENDVPSDDVFKLAKLLNEGNLLDIDRITVSKGELYNKFVREYGTNLSLIQFGETLEALKSIEIPMVDEGKETDVFFIHE